MFVTNYFPNDDFSTVFWFHWTFIAKFIDIVEACNDASPKYKWNKFFLDEQGDDADIITKTECA